MRDFIGNRRREFGHFYNRMRTVAHRRLVWTLQTFKSVEDIIIDFGIVAISSRDLSLDIV